LRENSSLVGTDLVSAHNGRIGIKTQKMQGNLIHQSIGELENRRIGELK